MLHTGISMESCVIKLTSLLLILSSCYCFKPNVVFILTDDQDTFIGGLEPMVKTKQWIGDQGVTFDMHVSSPLCCPSRGSIMTGRYPHNHAITNNSLEGNCSSREWQQGPEKRAFPVYFKQQGYNTFYAGKYLNQYGRPIVGGVEHVPPGWDWWIGLVGNSKYYDYTLSVNGSKVSHGHNYETDYFTDVVKNYSLSFLRSVANRDEPFMLMAATPSAHAPFTPAPQYKSAYSDKQPPHTASYNQHGSDKHWLIRQAKIPMTDDTVTKTNEVFRNRWRTLLSVDDMVNEIMITLAEADLLEKTFVIFASDNGYHIGQFGLPLDKRQLYEFDLKVPLMVRGPAIEGNQRSQALISNIDIAPTLLDIIGVETPSDMDGVSFLPLMKDPNLEPQWRSQVLIEHSGELGGVDPLCGYPPRTMGYCFNCVCEDSRNNTYHCTRTKSPSENNIYCVMQDDVSFIEMYNITTDPDQLKNLGGSLRESEHKRRKRTLETLLTCRGKSCKN